MLDSQSAVQLVTLKYLVRFLECSPRPFMGFINKDGVTPRFTRDHIKAKRARLNLPELGEEPLELIRSGVRVDVADVNLPPGSIPSTGSSGRADGRELAMGKAVLYLLLGFLEGIDCSGTGAKEDEGIALATAGGLIFDYIALLNGAEWLECMYQGLAGCVPADSMDEDIAVGDGLVRHGADVGEERRIVGDSIDEEADELIPVERHEKAVNLIKRRGGDSGFLPATVKKNGIILIRDVVTGEQSPLLLLKPAPELMLLIGAVVSTNLLS